mgnify:CR=1 FL=1
MTTQQTPRRTKSLKNLRQLLTEDEDGLEKFVYPYLRLGDVWWIPDGVTKFGNRERHPWVIVGPYSLRRANIFASPRTTKNLNKSKGVITPGGNPPGLDEEGIVLLNFRRPFSPKDFRDFDYVGRLPPDIIKEIRKFYTLEGSHGK